MATFNLQLIDAEVITLKSPAQHGVTWLALSPDGGMVILLGCAHEATARMEEEGLEPLFVAALSDEEIESLLE